MLETLSDWPTPPYFSFEPDVVNSEPEHCLIYFLNGKKATGYLIQISVDESSIVFLPLRSDVNVTFNLNQIKIKPSDF